MMRSVLAIFLLALLVCPAAGQCPGDHDGDGDVTVSELVAAVNAALNGCESLPPAEPCPIDFLSESLDACEFRGRIDPVCGGEIRLRFRQPGGIPFLTLDTDPAIALLALPDQLTVGQGANLIGWTDDPELNSSTGVFGDVELIRMGHGIRVSPIGIPFRIDGCPFTEFWGRFVRVVPAD